LLSLPSGGSEWACKWTGSTRGGRVPFRPVRSVGGWCNFLDQYRRGRVPSVPVGNGTGWCLYQGH